jgi:very-short-patch-repair endonuclease
MPPRLTAEARALLRSQRFVIATWQGASVDLASRAMRRAARDGSWTRVTGRTFLSIETEPDHSQLRMAGTLELGPTALLAGSSALVEQGWTGDPGSWVDVVVPPGAVPVARRLPPWLRLHRRAHARDALGVLPLVAAAESVLDAAAWARTDREAMFIAVSAMQQRIVTPNALARAIAHRPRLRRAGMVREVVTEFRTGATSMGELDLRRECRSRGLPEPIRQRPRSDSQGRVRFIDAEFRAADGAAVLVEVDGTGHFTPQGWLADVRRQRRVVVPDGARHLRVTNWELRHEPEEFFEDLRRAMRMDVFDF